MGTQAIRAELLVDSRARLAECPTWDRREGVLYWVDLVADSIHRTDPGTGRMETFKLGSPVSAIAPRRSGGLIVAGGSRFRIVDAAGLEPTSIADTGESTAELVLNDGKCDPQGRFWAGTKVIGGLPRSGTLYRLEPDGRLTAVLGQIGMSNGLGWSPDGRTFYYVDTPTSRIDRFDFEPEAGTLSGRRTFAIIDRREGIADGLTVDAEGCVWLALVRGSAVRRYSPAGEITKVIDVPASNVTSCTFGGERLDQLFITTAREGLSEGELSAQPLAGGIFCCEPGATGLPASEFGA